MYYLGATEISRFLRFGPLGFHPWNNPCNKPTGLVCHPAETPWMHEPAVAVGDLHRSVPWRLNVSSGSTLRLLVSGGVPIFHWGASVPQIIDLHSHSQRNWDIPKVYDRLFAWIIYHVLPSVVHGVVATCYLWMFWGRPMTSSFRCCLLPKLEVVDESCPSHGPHHVPQDQ